MRFKRVLVLALAALILTSFMSAVWAQAKPQSPAQTAEKAYDEGFKLMQQKKYQMAVEQFNNAIAKNPKFTKAYSMRGSCYFILKDYKAAIADMDKALEFTPQDVTSLFTRGQAYLFLGDSKKALVDFNALSKLQPENPKVYYQRAICYFRLGNLHECIQDCSKAISYAPKNPNAFALRGACYWRQDLTKAAVTDFERAIKIRPDDPYLQLFSYCAKAQIGQDGKKDLAAFYGRVKDKSWPYPAAGMFLGKISPEECMKAAKAAVKTQPEKGLAEQQSYFFVAQYFFIKGDKQKADTYMKKAESTGTDSHPFIQGLVKYQLKKARTK